MDAEIRAFLEMGRAEHIICCFLDDSAVLPEALQDREPLAADIVRDGWRNARLKIIAALIGCRFDDLRQRDLQRANRTMSIVASLSVAGLLLMGGLATYAFQARNEEERQRTLVQFHQSQAENLVAFMIGGMRKRLEPIGRLDILDAVGDEVMQYFASQPFAPLDPDITLRQAKALRQIGEVRVQQGKPAEGGKAFEQAVAQLDKALISNVDDEALLYEVSQLHFWIADAHLRLQEMDEAARHIESCLTISQRLAELRPENPDYQMEVAWAFSNLGTLAQRRGDPARARASFEHTKALQQDLVGRYPKMVSYRSELANTISWLATNAAYAGDLAESLSLYKEELTHRNAIEKASKDVRQRVLLARVHRWLGWTYSKMGRYGQAASENAPSEAIYRALVNHDPDNFDWRQELCWLDLQIAADQLQQGDASAALDYLTDVRAALANVDDDGADVGIPRLESALHAGFARYYLNSGKSAKAEKEARMAVDRISSLIADTTDDRMLVAFAEGAYLDAEATKTPGMARNALKQLNEHGRGSAELLAVKTLLAFEAGEMDLAQSYRQSLAQTDFVAPSVPGTIVAR